MDPVAEIVDCSVQTNAIERLLQELQDLRSQVHSLREENASLLTLKSQLEAERSNFLAVKASLAAAEGEIAKLRDHSQTLSEYIDSIERDGAFAPGVSRKLAKRRLDGDTLLGASNDRLANPDFIAANTNGGCNDATTNNNYANCSNSNILTTNVNSTRAQSSGNGNTAQPSNKKKIIQVIDSDLHTVKQNIKSANCSNFTLHQRTGKGPIKIAITNHAEIGKIRESLANNKLSFHEYKWQEEKFMCFVLRGLVGATPDDIPYIKQELLNAGLPNNISLVPLVTGYMRANPNAPRSTLFKLVVPPEFDVKLLQNIKFLDHVAVSFELLKNKRIIQCKNCQRFGHSAGGCQHPHRCVKCGQNHLRDNCPRTIDKTSKLRCCNCGGEHTANNLSACSFYLQRYAKSDSPAFSAVDASHSAGQLNKNFNIINTTSNASCDRSTRSSQPVASGLSYAQVLASRPGRSKLPSGSSRRSRSRSVQFGLASSTHSSVDIGSKLDMLIQLVSRHDAILQNLLNHG